MASSVTVPVLLPEYEPISNNGKILPTTLGVIKQRSPNEIALNVFKVFTVFGSSLLLLPVAIYPFTS